VLGRDPLFVAQKGRKGKGKGQALSSNATFMKGSGCEACRQTGYRGRLGIFELLTVNDTVRSQVQDRANATQIRDSAIAQGMRMLREDGLAKACAGQTTLEEVLRVTVVNM